jgi:hypothetical protein
MKELVEQLKKQLRKRYPQHFLIRRPVAGTSVFFVFVFCFAVVYRPLGFKSARSFSFDFTMLLYCLIISVSVFWLAMILKQMHGFSRNKEWTFARELSSILILLLWVGISVYFAGFIIEGPASRWNFSTFFDSLLKASLFALIPVLFFSLLNLRYLFTPETVQDFKTGNNIPGKENTEELIHITSKAKKEELSFYPSQFIYAESEGNYVVFYLSGQERPRRVVIRNSISEIERQLSFVPFFMRIHRAFIVNIRKVSSKRGNSLGYQVKVAGSNNELPVSRKNTKRFDQLIARCM